MSNSLEATSPKSILQRIAEYNPAQGIALITPSEENPELAGKLASGIHQAWLEEKTKQGWKFGEVYNADTKTDPKIVSYDKLSANEKASSINTAKMLLGYIEANGCIVSKLQDTNRAKAIAGDIDHDNLAEFLHDTWAVHKQSQGYVFGPTKSVTQKTSPCLVPFDLLPEHEKEMDRIVGRGFFNALSQEEFKVISKEKLQKHNRLVSTLSAHLQIIDPNCPTLTRRIAATEAVSEIMLGNISPTEITSYKSTKDLIIFLDDKRKARENQELLQYIDTCLSPLDPKCSKKDREEISNLAIEQIKQNKLSLKDILNFESYEELKSACQSKEGPQR